MTIDKNLLEDIGGESAGWTVEDRPAMTPEGLASDTLVQMIFHPRLRRAGFVVTGSGSSGQTFWTDAATIQEAWTRYDTDDLVN